MNSDMRLDIALWTWFKYIVILLPEYCACIKNTSLYISFCLIPMLMHILLNLKQGTYLSLYKI